MGLVPGDRVVIVVPPQSALFDKFQIISATGGLTTTTFDRGQKLRISTRPHNLEEANQRYDSMRPTNAFFLRACLWLGSCALALGLG